MEIFQHGWAKRLMALVDQGEAISPDTDAQGRSDVFRHLDGVRLLKENSFGYAVSKPSNTSADAHGAQGNIRLAVSNRSAKPRINGSGQEKVESPPRRLAV